ncbi:hypothetical protein [Endozoicomonas sp. 8E]|uniref:hypothetical protein n=1 Tax=Endozoicomonas sp. 8E TaxID=3035692 RepID=UPI002938DA11|nr:hypothetical protein [Endozoicomonas sp. 8E]WOG27322.1 hypothetical protein P6910_22670 [Endozoicomonas sp. 8E]
MIDQENNYFFKNKGFTAQENVFQVINARSIHDNTGLISSFLALVDNFHFNCRYQTTSTLATLASAGVSVAGLVLPAMPGSFVRRRL